MAENRFLEIYNSLLDYFGPQNWWPSDSSLEMIVGAVLTQNTNWQNVKKAIENLKKAGLLELELLVALTPEELANYIRPAGYYNLKAKRLLNLLHMIVNEYEWSLNNLLEDELENGRQKLLQVNGIGEETADSILLYAGGHKVFVVDAYTHRVFSRHNLLAEETSYQEIQEQFMANLPADAALFNEYHALIVKVAKEFCRKKEPLCQHCPLQKYL
ncbi:MAG: endonuclease III domain-containing protein [Desulfocapsaceae bacterium]|nr:endonuclease III domain-containing protein [Desulfocapsaceae bacterium]